MPASLRSFRQGAGLLLLAVLAVGAIGLSASAPAASALRPAAEADVAPRPVLAGPGVITGTITYDGTLTGTHMVWVGAFTTTLGGPPAYAVQRDGPGPYALTVEAGVYYLYAGMDADDAGGEPDPSRDPMGGYAHNPVTVTADALIADANIVLRDPGPPPTPLASIGGHISYSGQVTPTHQIIIIAQRQGDPGPPAYAAVIASAGAYTLTDVADGAYTVAAFMDLGDDMGPPQPNEPFGWYDIRGDGEADPVVVSGGQAVADIDIYLQDTQHRLYLPWVLTRQG